MVQRIYDRIREILETTPGLTQKGLADRMGLNPAAVNRMLYGRRNIMAEEIPMIEDYLGVRLDLSVPVVPMNIEYSQEMRASNVRRGFSDAPAAVPLGLFPASGPAAQMIPVYGHAGGVQKGISLESGHEVDWVMRHPAQFGVANAFALYTFSNTMEPRYFQGELMYIHPGRPPEMNRDCVIEMKNGEVYIKRFLRQDESRIRVAQFNPPREDEISKADIKAVYTVISRG